MQFIRTKSGVLIIGFIAIFVFLYLFTGVFGETRIGLTLRSNPDLENGLVAHYTFDGDSLTTFFGEFGDWGATTTDPTANGEDAFAITADENGFIYIAGCQTTSGFCPGTDDANYIVKMNAATGEEVWATSTNVNSNKDSITDITYFGGNLYVAAVCSCGPLGQTAFYTYKVDASNGDMLWATTTDLSSGGDVPGTNGITNDGMNIYVTGLCTSCSGDTRHYTMKIDSSDGSMIWATSTYAGTNKSGSSIVFANSNLYVTGAGEGVDDEHITYSVDPSDGSMGWSTTTNPSSSNSETSYDITFDGSYLYVVGTCRECVPTDQTYYTYKVDPSDGSMLWATTTNPTLSASDTPWSITTDGTNIYVAGDCTGCGSKGSTAHYVMKVDASNGDMLWATSTDPTASFDSAIDIVYSNSYLYVTGFCDGCGAQGGDSMYTYRIDPATGNMVSTTSNTVTDNAGNNDGDAYASVGIGNIGQGVEFDGVDDYIEVPDSAALSPSDELTMAAWVYFDPSVFSSGAYQIIAKPNSASHSNPYFTYSLHAGDITGCGGGQFTLRSFIATSTSGGSFTYACSGAIFSANTWYHAVGVYDRQTLKLYIDGVEVASVVETNPLPDTSQPLKIGANADIGEVFNGKIDDVRIYNRALAASEVKRLYDLGATTKIAKTLDSNPDLEENLVGHWTFDGDLSTQVTDRSGNSNHGYFSASSNSTSSLATAGVLGQGLTFDGTNDYIVVPYSAELAGGADVSISLAGWFKLASTSDQKVIIRKWEGSSYKDWELNYHDHATWGTGVRFWLENGSNNDEICRSEESVTGTLRLGEWYHAVATYDGVSNVCTMYINGAFASSTTFTYDMPARTDDIQIGGETYQEGAGFKMNGSIDDVRVYKKALTPSEVSRLYELGATTKIAKTIDTNPDLKNGLVGHWTFDGSDINLGSTAAEVQERTGVGNDGNWVNHDRSTTFGALGQALDFDGVDDYVTVANYTDINFGAGDSFSWAYWIKTTTSVTSARVFEKWEGSAANPYSLVSRLYDSSGEVYGAISDGTNNPLASSTIVVNDGNWHHVAFIRDVPNDNLRIYVDGQLEDTETDTTTGSLSTTEPLILARRGNLGVGFEYDGAMDDLRIYNRVLSDAEILRLYQLGN